MIFIGYCDKNKALLIEELLLRYDILYKISERMFKSGFCVYADEAKIDEAIELITDSLS